VLPFREFLGGFSQSFTRWPLAVRDRHGHDHEEPDLHHSAGLSLVEHTLAARARELLDSMVLH
jgi:hypothetical protein